MPGRAYNRPQVDIVRTSPRDRSGIFLFAVLMLGLGFVTHNVFPRLSHEDPGRDVYSTWRFLNGELPYRDFHWTYGPLFLPYLASLFKLLGASLWTALIGFKLAQAVSCAFIFLAARRLFGPSFALAGVALHYYLGEIDHTFNHGLVMAFLSIWLWLLVVEGTAPGPFSKGRFCGIAAVLMGLFQTKVNYGLGCTAGTLLFVLLKHIQAPGGHFPWARLLFLGAAWPAVAAIPYVLLMKDLPVDRIMLCHAAGRGKIYLTFPVSWEQFWITPLHLFSNPVWALHDFAVENFLLVLSALSTLSWALWRLFHWMRDRATPFPALAVLSPAVLYILAHEFLMGSWNAASLGYHASGLYGLVLAGLCRLAVPEIPLLAGRLTSHHAVSCALVLIWSALAIKDPVRIRWRGMGQFLDHPGTRIWFWGDPHPMAEYGRNMLAIAREFEKITRPDDTCAVFPRGSLYFFLAQRRRSNWLEEADAQFLTDQHEEEARIVREMEERKVRWILFSNYARYLSTCTLNNNFGEHYARDALDYIRARYEEVSRVPRGPLRVYRDGEPFRNELHQIQFLRRLPEGAPPADLELPVTAR